MNRPKHGSQQRRRWQFTITGWMTVTTGVAVVLAYGSAIGWPRVVMTLHLATSPQTWGDTWQVPLLMALCWAHSAGPMFAFFAWIPVRRRKPWLQVLLVALPLALLLTGMIIFVETHNPQSLGRMLRFTALTWPPQALVWWIVGAFIRRGERSEEKEKQDDSPADAERLKAMQAAFVAELTERTRGDFKGAAANSDKQGEHHARIT